MNAAYLGGGTTAAATAGAGGVAAGGAAAGAAAAGGRRGIGGMIAGMFGPTAAMKEVRAGVGARIGEYGGMAKGKITQGLGKLLTAVPILSQIGKVAKFIPGGAVLGGAVDFGFAKMAGQSTDKAAVGAIGSVIGATVGSALGPIGTVAGGVLGSIAGDFIYSSLSPSGRAQEEAAKVQKQAADLQMQASKNQELANKLGVGDLTHQWGQSAEVNKRFEALGYGSNPLVKTFEKEYLERNIAMENLKVAQKKLEKERTRLTVADLKPKDMNARLKPLEDAVASAAGRLKTEEAQQAAAYAKLPIKIQDAIVNNITKVSFQRVADAIANAVGLAAARATARGYRVDQNPPPPPKEGDKDFIGPVLPPQYRGGLGDAILKEMRMKPPGSGLVIANSSETVIPAAGGYGMKDFMGYLRSGFDQMATVIPRAVKMGSVGNNPYGGFGGRSIGSINVTVNAGSATDREDYDTLASIIAMKISEAVSDACAASVFV